MTRKISIFLFYFLFLLCTAVIKMYQKNLITFQLNVFNAKMLPLHVTLIFLHIFHILKCQI